MAFDEVLADRIRRRLSRRSGITERRMFGGIAFMLNGHMACGVIADHLVVRLGEEQADRALRRADTREMDFTGKPMKSMVYVRPEGTASDRALQSWITQALAFARSLPPKPETPSRKPASKGKRATRR